MKFNYKSSIGVLLFITCWIVFISLGIWSPYILPSPLKVIDSFFHMLISGELFIDIFHSFKRVFMGFLFSVVMGISTALILYMNKGITEYFGFFKFFKNIPPLSIVPLLILWFGIGEESKVILIVYSAFFPIFANTSKGFSSCDKKLLEVGKIFKFSKFKLFYKIVLPSAVTDILTGMKIGLSYSWRSIIGAEMIAASNGLGHLIVFSQETSRSDRVIVGMISIGIVALISDFLFSKLIKRKEM